MDHSLINDIAICIIVAWILAVGAQLLKQPLILAYLVAGYAIGPGGAALIRERTSIETISGLGLILLLFMIGLEIDLKKMMNAGRAILATAAAQIIGGCVLGIAFFYALGFPLRAGSLDALYLAVAACLSSTVIIIKILYEKRELDTYAGRLTVGVLVLQDLFAILFLAIQPDLKDPSLKMMVWSLLKVALLVLVAFLLSRYALPTLFRAVARLPELVLVGALAWCFLISGAASYLGLSREMGALISGVAISTFPYTLDVTAKVTSLRDFFVTLFFVGLGMGIPEPTTEILLLAVAAAAFVIGSRFLTVAPSLVAMKAGHRASLLPALNLSQISELSLIIMALGLASGHISTKAVHVISYCFVFLAIISTYAMVRSEFLVNYGIKFMNRLRIRDLGEVNEGLVAGNPTIFVLGFSWTASSLVEELTRKQPEILPELAIVDFNPRVHQELKQRGIRAIYGDISQRDTLVHAGVDRAEIIVCTLPNTVLKGVNNLRLLQTLREINPDAQIIMHAELFADVPKLYAAGASYVSVPRLIESIELAEVLQAAREKLLEEKTTQQQSDLLDRHEVIP